MKDESGIKPLFPDWKKVLALAAEELADQKKYDDSARLLANSTLGPEGYLKAAQIAWDGMVTPGCPEFIKRVFEKSINDAMSGSLDLAKSVWKLGSRRILTTNFDPVLHWACPEIADHRTLYRQKNELAWMVNNDRGGRYTTWHLHGSVFHSVGDIVFTEKQYDKFYHGREFEAILKQLDFLLSGKTFLFIGFSLNDVYFRERMRYIYRLYDKAAGSFYVLLHKDTPADPEIDNMVIRIPFDDFEFGLLERMKELSRMAGEDTAFIAGRSSFHKSGENEKPPAVLNPAWIKFRAAVIAAFSAAAIFITGAVFLLPGKNLADPANRDPSSTGPPFAAQAPVSEPATDGANLNASANRDAANSVILPGQNKIGSRKPSKRPTEDEALRKLKEMIDRRSRERVKKNPEGTRSDVLQ